VCHPEKAIVKKYVKSEVAAKKWLEVHANMNKTTVSKADIFVNLFFLNMSTWKTFTAVHSVEKAIQWQYRWLDLKKNQALMHKDWLGDTKILGS